MKTFKLLFASMLVIALSGCFGSKDQLKKTLEENPDILTNAIEKNPDKIMEALNNAVREAQKKQFEDREKALTKERDEEFKNPKNPKVSNERVWGSKDAPITIVEYSDFECPYCKRGYTTLEEVRKKYGDKVKVIFKHLPLDFHPMAMPAAKYYEAVAMQDISMAKKFHDMLFEKQAEMTAKKEKFLAEVAGKVGADVAKVKKDAESEAVKKRIAEDMEEARNFGFNGTPGYLINGISIRGAYPAEEFSKIIDQLLAAKK